RVLTLNEDPGRPPVIWRPATNGQERRLPGRYGRSMRTVATTRAISTVIMNASKAFPPIAQRTIQIMSPIVVATTISMGGNLADGSGGGGGGRASGVRDAVWARSSGAPGRRGWRSARAWFAALARGDWRAEERER